jgi:transcriptional regulator with XRE-family HTH domain
MARRVTLREQVAENLRRLARERPRGWAARFCERYQVWPSTLARVLSGAQAATLDLLEQVAEMEMVSPLQLLAGPGDDLKPVSPLEQRLLRYVRPPLMQGETLAHLLGFLEYYASEPPVEREQRTALDYLRKLTDGQRNRVLAYMILLHEGLPRDLTEPQPGERAVDAEERSGRRLVRRVAR